MKIFKACWMTVLTVLILHTAAFSQYYEHSTQSGIGIPFFDLVMHKQFAEDEHSHRLLIMTRFLYDDLTFIRSDSSGYDTDFEMLFAVYDESGSVIRSRTINQKEHVNAYERTNSRDDKFVISDTMSLPPGKFTLLAKANDLISNETAQRKLEFTLEPYNEMDVSISGILFLTDAKLDSAGRVVSFVPSVGNNFTARSGYFYIYFDLFLKDPENPVTMNYKMIPQGKKPELDTTIVRKVDKRVTSHLLKIEKDRLRKNKYVLDITVDSDGETVKISKPFSFYWADVPRTTEDIDLALEQMTYIINNDSLDKYEDATLQEKQAYFKRFWERRDPDPTTTKNELKNEYFKRVNYANRNFSAFSQKGWLTDRGRILIKFGFPDDIDRHPFDMGSRPFEIWRYYALRKTFLFEDRTGFGDYRLHPNYLDVEFQ